MVYKKANVQIIVWVRTGDFHLFAQWTGSASGKVVWQNLFCQQASKCMREVNIVTTGPYMG